MMGKLLEGFKILCSDFDHTYFGKKEDIVLGRILIKEMRYLSLFGKYEIGLTSNSKEIGCPYICRWKKKSHLIKILQTESVAIELLYWENMRAPAFYHCQQIKWLRKKPYNKKLMTLFWPSCNVILLCQNWLRAPAFYHQPTKKIGPKIVGKKAI